MGVSGSHSNVACFPEYLRGLYLSHSLYECRKKRHITRSILHKREVNLASASDMLCSVVMLINVLKLSSNVCYKKNTKHLASVEKEKRNVCSDLNENKRKCRLSQENPMKRRRNIHISNHFIPCSRKRSNFNSYTKLR